MRILLTLSMLLVWTQAIPASAQEIGLFGGHAWSDRPRSGDPAFFGIRFQYRPVSRLGARVEYTGYSSSPRWVATTCDAYWPFYENCRDETVENGMRLRSYDFSIVAVPLLLHGWRVDLAVGISQNALEQEVRGVETGRILYTTEGYGGEPFEDILSFLGRGGNGSVQAVTLSRVGIRELPIVLGVSYRRRSVDTPSCGTDSYCLYTGDLHLSELALHGSWSF